MKDQMISKLSLLALALLAGASTAQDGDEPVSCFKGFVMVRKSQRMFLQVSSLLSLLLIYFWLSF